MRVFVTLVWVLCITISCTTEKLFKHPSIDGFQGVVHVVVDDHRFTAEQKHLIRLAINVWDEKFLGWIDWNFDENLNKSVVGQKTNDRCNDVIIVRSLLSTDEKVIKRDNMLNLTTLGLTLRKECSITHVWLVSDRLSSSYDFMIIAAHELGHAIGLSHVNDSRSIMNRYYNNKLVFGDVTDSDMFEFCREFNCDVTMFNQCRL